MNHYIFEIEKNTNHINFEPSQKQLKFKIKYQNKEDFNDVEEEEKEEIITKENLVINVKLRFTKENEEYVLEFDKVAGDKMEFIERLEDLQTIADSLM